MPTIIVNFRKEPCDVKITRTPKNEIPPPPTFGWAGNPFPVEQYGREKCLELYNGYFKDRIENDPAFREAILALRDKRLGCFCKPLACHGDIIKEWLDTHNEFGEPCSTPTSSNCNSSNSEPQSSST